jgi:nucleoid-associated protein YgaU
MARETKVGLLAGLAFIICFAIILANRGREDSSTTKRSMSPDPGTQLPAALQQMATRSAGPAPAVSQSYSAANHGAAVPPSHLPVGTTRTISPPYPGLPDELARVTSPVAGAPGGPPERPLTSRTQDSISSPPGSVSPVAETRAAGPPYTVAPGDTLSKIALAHYGKKSRSTVQAIYEMNRSVLQNPDNLKTGMVLQLPLVDDRASQKTEPAATVPTAKPRVEEAKITLSKKPAEPRTPGFRWYQVRKNDRYMSIAREQLGDGARWRELHEMNKDRFPDPGMIREGVRIKLPAAKGLATAEGRR